MKTNIFIKTRRQELGLTMKELAAKVGVSEATVSRWESGEITNMRKNALYKLADALNVTPVELMDEVEDRYSIIEFIKSNSNTYPNNLQDYDYEALDDLKLAVQLQNQIPTNTPAPAEGTSINFQPKGVQIPVLGCVIAGVPIEAVEDILGYEEISSSLAATGEFFCLKIKGDSMEPTFTEGDIIVVRQQPDVETNEIAIVLVNGDEGTVKRIKKEDHGIFLIGDNAMAFSPKFYSNKEIRDLPVKIIGKVVELRRSF